MKSYEVNQRNKVKRVPSRGNYDAESVYNILDAGVLCHVGFVVDHQPFVIPTLYGRYENKLYLHGAASSRMLKELDKGTPVCVTVTHVDGLVLARSIFHHSMNYRSAVIFGTATKVKDEDKEQALYIVSENIIKDRWSEARPPSEKEMKATTVLQIEIDQASTKVRKGPPGDDKEDYDLDVWAGVIPFETIAKDPVTDEVLKEGIKVPKSVIKYRPKK